MLSPSSERSFKNQRATIIVGKRAVAYFICNNLKLETTQMFTKREWIINYGNIHTMDYYSAKKKE